MDRIWVMLGHDAAKETISILGFRPSVSKFEALEIARKRHRQGPVNAFDMSQPVDMVGRSMRAWIMAETGMAGKQADAQVRAVARGIRDILGDRKAPTP